MDNLRAVVIASRKVFVSVSVNIPDCQTKMLSGPRQQMEGCGPQQ